MTVQRNSNHRDNDFDRLVKDVSNQCIQGWELSRCITTYSKQHKDFPYEQHKNIIKAAGKAKKLSNFIFVPLLKSASYRDDLETGKYLLNVMQEKGIKHDEFTNESACIIFSKMVNENIKENNFLEMKNNIDALQRYKIDPNFVVYNTLIKGYCGKGEMGTALEYFKKIQEARMKPTIVTYTTLIKGYCDKGEMETALEYFEEMQGVGITPTVVTYNTLIKGYCDKGEMETALEYFEKIQGARMTPTVVTYTMLIKGYCDKGEMETAREYFEKIQGARMTPTVVTYTTLIKGCCDKGEMGTALKYFGKMQDARITLTIVTYSTLIKGFCDTGDMDNALVYFKQMQEAEIDPNIMIYNMLIKGYCDKGEMETALKYFGKMQDARITPTIVTYSTLIKGFCGKGEMGNALEYFKKIQEARMKPTIVTYTTLIKGFCDKGDMDNALVYFRKIREAEMRPDLVTYSTIIDGYCKRSNKDDLEIAKQLFKNMQTVDGIPPDEVICAIIIKGYCKIGDMDVAEKIFRSVESKSLTNQCSLVEMVKGYGKKILYQDEALQYFNKALTKDLDATPDPWLVATMLQNYRTVVTGNSIQNAVELFENMLKSGLTPTVVIFNILISHCLSERREDLAAKYFKKMEEYRIEPDHITYRIIFKHFAGHPGGEMAMLRFFGKEHEDFVKKFSSDTQEKKAPTNNKRRRDDVVLPNKKRKHNDSESVIRSENNSNSSGTTKIQIVNDRNITINNTNNESSNLIVDLINNVRLNRESDLTFIDKSNKDTVLEALVKNELHRTDAIRPLFKKLVSISSGKEIIDFLFEKISNKNNMKTTVKYALVVVDITKDGFLGYELIKKMVSEELQRNQETKSFFIELCKSLSPDVVRDTLIDSFEGQKMWRALKFAVMVADIQQKPHVRQQHAQFLQQYIKEQQENLAQANVSSDDINTELETLKKISMSASAGMEKISIIKKN